MRIRLIRNYDDHEPVLQEIELFGERRKSVSLAIGSTYCNVGRNL